MKILITGASGFIGKNLIRYYLKENNDVTGIYRGKKPLISKSNHLKLIKADLNNNKFILNFFFDVVIHCAAETPVTSKNDNNLYRNNINSIKNLLKKTTFDKFFFLSTMSIYGKTSVKIVDEKTPPLNICMYGSSKLESEKLLKKYSNIANSKCVSLRLPGVVGKGSHGNFISEISKKMKKQQLINPKNPDSIFNNIVHVKKLFEFITKEINFDKKNYYCVNIASHKKIKIKSILNFLKKNLNYKKNYNLIEDQKKSFIIDISKAREIGYKPWSVRQSLKNYIRNI